MASLRQLVFERNTTYAPLLALIGTRCYPERVPENATYPLVVYSAPIADDDTPYRTHDNATDRTQSLVSHTVYADTGDQAEAIGDVLVDAWNGYKSGCDIGFAFVQNRIADRQDDLRQYTQIIDVLVEHAR